MSLFICPICGGALTREDRSYRCPNGHSYDIAREGYVHLLPANKKHSKDPGDDKAMVAARSRFLESGCYSHLCGELCQLALAYTGERVDLLDAGCGEGYYTADILAALTAAGRTVRGAGVDLSKHALKKAARRAPQGEFAVASVYHLPLAGDSADLLVDCFAPMAAEEYGRVLRSGGVLLYVVPAPEHLMEMKAILYDDTYENPDQTVDYEGFTWEKMVPVSRQVTLRGQTIMDLFGMTPYAWKTPKAGVERLAALEELTVTAAFRIHVFRKN